MIGDTDLITLESGHNVLCQQVTLSGRKVAIKSTGLEAEVVGMRAGFGPRERNAWVLVYPDGRHFVLTLGQFRLI